MNSNTTTTELDFSTVLVHKDQGNEYYKSKDYKFPKEQCRPKAKVMSSIVAFFLKESNSKETDLIGPGLFL